MVKFDWKTIPVAILIIAGVGVLIDFKVSERWEAPGRNLKRANKLSLGVKYNVDFENALIEVSKDTKFKKVSFALPHILADPSGYIIYRESDKIIVKMRINEKEQSVKNLPEIEWQ